MSLLKCYCFFSDWWILISMCLNCLSLFCVDGDFAAFRISLRLVGGIVAWIDSGTVGGRGDWISGWLVDGLDDGVLVVYFYFYFMTS